MRYKSIECKKGQEHEFISCEAGERKAVYQQGTGNISTDEKGQTYRQVLICRICGLMIGPLKLK